METKICKVCNEEKELEKFSLQYNKKYPELRKAHCKKCENKRREEWRKTNVKRKEYKKKHNREWMRKNKEKTRANYLKRTYNLTIEDYEVKQLEQNFRCAICNEESKLVVDHCHTTGKVRDLLCDKCNSGIGYFRENPQYLKSAIRYIRKHTK